MTTKRKEHIEAAVNSVFEESAKLNKILWKLKKVLGEANCDSEGAVNDCIYDIEHALERLHGHILEDLEA